MQSLLELHSCSTTSTFGTRSSVSKQLPKVIGASDENQAPNTEPASTVSTHDIVLLIYSLSENKSALESYN